MTLSPILTSFDELVLEHLPLARHHALQYRGRGVELEELVQVANLALVKAAHGFDANRGAFAPYAAATIRGDIKKYFRDHAWSVRPPRRVQELQAAITAATDAAAGHHDIDELASDLDVEPEDVVEALSARGCFRSESTDRETGSSGLTIGETLASTDSDLELVEEWVTFCALSRELTRDERELLRMRFVDDLTQQEIADQLGVSQMQVSRRLRKVLETMRRQVSAYDHEVPPEAA
ncbi:MAG: sigma-70 family RNA polymerase sigma factor [Aeromicrobium sp.]